MFGCGLGGQHSPQRSQKLGPYEVFAFAAQSLLSLTVKELVSLRTHHSSKNFKR